MTNDEIRVEVRETVRDLNVFAAMDKLLKDRLQELEDSPERYRRLAHWAGTQALLHMLVMCKTRCRGLIEDLQKNIDEEAEVVPLHAVERSDD